MLFCGQPRTTGKDGNKDKSVWLQHHERRNFAAAKTVVCKPQRQGGLQDSAKTAIIRTCPALKGFAPKGLQCALLFAARLFAARLFATT